MNRRAFFLQTVGLLVASRLPIKKMVALDIESYVTPLECDMYVMGVLRSSGPMTFAMNFPPVTSILESLQPLPVGTFITSGHEGRVKLAEEGDRVLGVVTGNGGTLGKNGLWTHQVTIEPYAYD